MITFEAVARIAIEKMQGLAKPTLPLLRARLTQAFRQKPGLTRFIPAKLNDSSTTIEAVSTQGSGDVNALARANAFIVTDPERELWSAGEDIQVLLK